MLSASHQLLCFSLVSLNSMESVLLNFYLEFKMLLSSQCFSNPPFPFPWHRSFPSSKDPERTSSHGREPLGSILQWAIGVIESIPLPSRSQSSQRQVLGVAAFWFPHNTLHRRANIMSDQYRFPKYITLTCTQKLFDIKTTLKNKGGKKNGKTGR